MAPYTCASVSVSKSWRMVSGDSPSRNAWIMESRETRVPAIKKKPSLCSTYSCAIRSESIMLLHHDVHQLLQDFGHRGGGEILLFRVKHVDQLHDTRDARIEVPAGFEVLRDLRECLVQLAENLLVGGARGQVIGPPGIACGEAVDAAEESVDALGALLPPVNLFLRRRGEEDEHTRRVGAESLGQHVGAHH